MAEEGQFLEQNEPNHPFMKSKIMPAILHHWQLSIISGARNRSREI